MITEANQQVARRNKQLMAILQPDGLFELEWQASDQILDRNDMCKHVAAVQCCMALGHGSMRIPRYSSFCGVSM